MKLLLMDCLLNKKIKIMMSTIQLNPNISTNFQ
jgi:hypothetical protein